MGLFTRKRKPKTSGASPRASAQPAQNFALEVPAREVSEANTERYEHFIEHVLSAPDVVVGTEGRLCFFFPDYEDAEFVFLVPEVRRWVRTLHQRVKHLLYFLDLEPLLAQGLEFKVAFALDEQIERVGDEMGVGDSPQVTEALSERLVAVGEFAAEVGADARAAVDRVARSFFVPDDAAEVTARVVATIEKGD